MWVSAIKKNTIRQMLCLGLLLAHFHSWAELPSARIAIIGGTHLNDALFFKDIFTAEAQIETRLGLSQTIYYGEYQSVPFYYVPFHGQPFLQASWVALYDLHVTEVIGGATAGGINPDMELYDFVIPHDFIDMNVDRPLGFPRDIYRDPENIPLPRYIPAMDPLLRDILIEGVKDSLANNPSFEDVKLHESGVLLQARGGRFETAAEIRMFAGWGGELVTLNVGTEMAYARMLGMNYASLNIISNPAEGVGKWDFDSIPEVYRRMNPLAADILLQALPKIAALEGLPRVGDELRIHPEFTSKPEDQNEN